MNFKNIRDNYFIRKKFGHNKISLNVSIHNVKYIEMGKDINIAYGTRIETIDKWGTKSYNPQIIIGNGVNIEQGCHITCANCIIIEKGVSLLPYCMITDISHNYEKISIPPNKQSITVKKTIIKEQSSIGYGACIMPGVTVGRHSIIGANSVVVRDVPDYCVAVGVPAKIIKKYDTKLKKWVLVE